MTGRFAPTPSGRMHVGNVYAMLAAWLSARARGRRMLLRIEDVDKPRVLPGADRLMMDDLTWLGLDWAGGPVYQSSAERQSRYAYALECLRSAVYPCFCSRADIRAASAPNEGDGFTIYPGTCRHVFEENPETVSGRVTRGDRHSLRIVMPDVSDSNAAVCFDDAVFGWQSFNLPREVGDSVVRRADGLFGYQLVVVVDDLDMGVDDIVRGRDLLRSTALQIWIRQCLLAGGFVPERPASGDAACETSRETFCETPRETDAGAAVSPVQPQYAHLPLINNAVGRRLAKRERSLDMGALRARGVRPEQIIGYCAWLLRLRSSPVPCRAADLLDGFSWTGLRNDHADRELNPADPNTPGWLAAAL